MTNFSPQLLTKAKTYFSHKLKREVLDDEAEQFLLSIVSLFDLFTSTKK